MSKYKVFISYSRESSVEKNKLIEYLRPHIDEERLDVWHDRELKAGDRFDDIIKSKLLNSDIVIFLLSQHFLNSEYCREVEEELALQKYATSAVDSFRIIPIIASKCFYKKSKLKDFNMPLDAKAISEYGDDAYFDISKEIEAVLDMLDENTGYQKNNSHESQNDINRVSNEFEQHLRELGFTIQKNGIDKIELLDLFVFPDLKKINNEIEDIDVFVDSKKIISDGKIDNSKRLFLGDEQSGKSTLAKMLFLKAIDLGLTPVIVKGDEIKGHKEIHKIIERNYEFQYKESSFFRTTELVLIIDGISDSQINQKFMKLLISNELSQYDRVFITCDSMVRMQDQIMNEFNDYDVYEIQNLGSKKKDELINKWNMLGRDESNCIKDIQSNHDYLIRSIESIMMRNIVPSKPIFILMILQILETHKASDFTLTSYGHCYHSLIIDAFNRANIRSDLHSDYFNYLSELAYYMYSNSKVKVEPDEIKEFQKIYSENYLVNSHDEVFDKIIKSKIIVKDYKDTHKFQYKYLFYFFIAKHISDSEHLLQETKALCDKIHSEKHANILIFVTHHTKQKLVIDTIIDEISSIFSDQKPAKLDYEELSFLNELAKKIPQMVIDNSKDVEEERQKELEKKDKFEKNNLLQRAHDNNEEDDDNDLDVTNQDLLDVNRSYRALEILGQIIRNRKGSLPKPLLNKLGNEAYTVGLRFLKYYLGITQDLKEEIIEEIHRLIETKKSWSNERIAQEARFYYWTFSYVMSLNVIRKTALSVGHKDLTNFYEQISEEISSEVAKLIEVQIEIEFTKKIPKQKLTELWKKMEGNLVTRRLLQEIMVRHLHLNYVDHNEKQWISANLDIPLLDQERFQQKVKSVKQSAISFSKRA